MKSFLKFCAVFVVLVFCLFVGIAILGFLFGEETTKKTSDIVPKQNQAQVAGETDKQEEAKSLPAEVKADKKYTEIFRFSGTGTKKSEPFSIKGDKYKVAFDYKANGYCGIRIESPGSKFGGDLLVNSTEDRKDESIQYEKGDFYFDVTGCGAYNLIVYDFV